MNFIPFISSYFLFLRQPIMTLNYYESYETGKQNLPGRGKMGLGTNMGWFNGIYLSQDEKRDAWAH